METPEAARWAGLGSCDCSRIFNMEMDFQMHLEFSSQGLEFTHLRLSRMFATYIDFEMIRDYLNYGLGSPHYGHSRIFYRFINL